MTLLIELPPELESKVRDRAAASGKDPAQVVISLLAEQLDAVGAKKAEELSPEQWVREWRAWAASHRALPSEIDDSPESIYAGCGE